MDDARDPLVIRDSDVELERWSDPVRGELGFRTLMGSPGSAPRGFTAGVAELGPDGWLALHRHDPPEVYYVLSGRGTLTVDGVEHAVGAGTAVHIPGSSEHGIRNAGSEPLRFFYAFAVGSFEDVEYRFG